MRNTWRHYFLKTLKLFSIMLNSNNRGIKGVSSCWKKQKLGFRSLQNKWWHRKLFFFVQKFKICLIEIVASSPGVGNTRKTIIFFFSKSTIVFYTYSLVTFLINLLELSLFCNLQLQFLRSIKLLKILKTPLWKYLWYLLYTQFRALSWIATSPEWLWLT